MHSAAKKRAIAYEREILSLHRQMLDLVEEKRKKIGESGEREYAEVVQFMEERQKKTHRKLTRALQQIKEDEKKGNALHQVGLIERELFKGRHLHEREWPELYKEVERGEKGNLGAMLEAMKEECEAKIGKRRKHMNYLMKPLDYQSTY